MPSADGPVQPGAAPARRARRWWWRWLRRLLIAVVLLRVLLWLFLLPIADFGAGFVGLRVQWRAASLSLLGMSLHIEDLEVRDRDHPEAPPLLAAQEFVADASTRQLLGGELAIVDVGLAGARLHFERRADGSLALPAAWLPADAPAADTTPEQPAPEATGFDFRLPFRVASARVHDLQVEFVDGATAPTVVRTARLDLDIADLGFPDRTGSVGLRLHVPELCDELWLQASTTATTDRLLLRWQSALRGVHPLAEPVPTALRRQITDLLDGADTAGLEWDGELTATVPPGERELPALAGETRLLVSLDGEPRLHLTAGISPGEAKPGEGAGKMPFWLRFGCDELVRSIELADGHLQFAGQHVALHTTLRIEELTCRRIAPLLAASGVELPPRGLDMRARLVADLNAKIDASLTDVVVAATGEDEPLLSLPRVEIRGLHDTDELHIEEVTILGPEVSVQREADGNLRIAGLRLATGARSEPAEPAVAAAAPSGATPPAPKSPASTAPNGLPRIEVARLRWTGARLSFIDQTLQPAAALTIDDVELTGTDLALGDGRRSLIAVQARVPGSMGRLRADLTLADDTDRLRADCDLRLTELTLRSLAPWLAAAGLRSELTEGALTLVVGGELRHGHAAPELAVQLRNLRMTDGDRTLLGVRAIDGTGIKIAVDGLDLGTWTVREPFAELSRDASSQLHALGLATVPAPGTAQVAGKGPTAITPTPNGATSPRHGELRIEGGAVRWYDATRGDRPRTLTLTARLGANDGSGAAQPFELTARVEGALDELRLDGGLQFGATDLAVSTKLTGRGLHGGELAAMLPPGVACSLVDGELDAQLALRATADGGGVALALRGVQLRDRGEELLALDALGMEAPALGAESVHIARLELEGLRALVARTEHALHVPGFDLADAPAAAASEPPPTTPAPSGAAPASSSELPRPAPLALPPLRLDVVRLAVERLTLHDRRGAGGEPLTVEGTVALREGWRGDPRAEPGEPLRLDLSAAAEPLGAAVAVELAVQPFALAPTVDATIALTGLDTTAFTRVVPTLTSVRGDATSLSLTATLHARLDLRRRDAARFDFAAPFGGEVVVDDLQVRDAASEREFLRIDTVDVLLRALDPASGALLLRAVEIDGPRLSAANAADGIHVLGVVLVPPPTDAATPTPPTPRPGAAPPPEIAIDRLRVLGLAVRFDDATTNPATRLAAQDTDFELQRFSTRSWSEVRPFSFSLSASGGDIPLEKRVLRSSPLSGLLSSAAGALTGQSDQHEIVSRSMFDRIDARGTLTLYPQPKGSVDVAVDGLELSAFRGLAKRSGVDIADGLYDLRLALGLRGYDGIDIQSQSVFTWLSLSEPPGGPISTYLRLPAPLDTVLFALRNEQDEQRLPLRLHVPFEGAQATAAIDAFVEALTKLIAASVSSVGMRAASALTGALFGVDDRVPDVRAAVAFGAGDPLPGAADLAAIQRALTDDPSLSVVLTHELGDGDLVEAARLANPPRDVVQRTVEELLATQRELQTRRGPLADTTRALFAAGRRTEALERWRELQDVDERLGDLHLTLDAALDRLQGENERVARRRTRAAAAELAAARLEAVQQTILRGAPAVTTDRVEVRTGRSVPTEGLAAGGRVLAVVRRRAAK